MKINISCCGIFHYTKYLKYIDQYGVLNKFFYSHKLNTNSNTLLISKEKLVNAWIKEYLVFGHVKILNNQFANNFFPIYHDVWESIVLLYWSGCNIFHAMLHGNSRKLLQRAKQENSLIIGEPVNSHPEFYYSLLQEEYRLLGIKKELKISKQYRRLIEEVDMCDYLLSPSKFIENSFIENGLDGKKSYLIPWGVDLSKFAPLSDDANFEYKSTFRVICVAHISPRKGHKYLLEAWRKLNLPNSELLLIGKIFDEMKPVISQYEGIFKHIPSVPHDQLHQYYGISSVFVLPSIEDGFAYVCTEAMACGLPVITTTNAGASELIEHGKEGFIVPIRSPEAIGKYLERLYCSDELRQEMSKAALKKSKADFSWEKYAQSLYKLYTELFNTSKKY
jgi:glycosyltransferase involved in cell wall biosynthesis